MTKTLALLAAGLCAAILPVAAQATVYEDAANYAVSATESYSIGTGPRYAFAQTFTAETSGYIVGVLLPIGCHTDPMYVVLASVTPEGFPASDVLTGTLLPAESIQADGRFTLATFPGPLQVSAGSRYALILATVEHGVCWIRRSTAGAAYAGGRAFGWMDANPTWFQLSLIGHPDDLPFQVLMAF